MIAVVAPPGNSPGLPETPYGAAVDVLDELRQGRARLGLVSDIQIALPTEREVARFWQ